MQQKVLLRTTMYGFLYYELLIALCILSFLTIVFAQSLGNFFNVLDDTRSRCAALDLAAYYLDRCISLKECPRSGTISTINQYVLQYTWQQRAIGAMQKSYIFVTVTVTWIAKSGKKQLLALSDWYFL